MSWTSMVSRLEGHGGHSRAGRLQTRVAQVVKPFQRGHALPWDGSGGSESSVPGIRETDVSKKKPEYLKQQFICIHIAGERKNLL